MVPITSSSPRPGAERGPGIGTLSTPSVIQKPVLDHAHKRIAFIDRQIVLGPEPLPA